MPTILQVELDLEHYGQLALLLSALPAWRRGSTLTLMLNKGPRKGQRLRAYFVRRGTRRVFQGSWVVVDCAILWVALQEHPTAAVTLCD